MFRRFLFNTRMAIRIWMRNRTRPLTIEEAEEKKYFWSKTYMYCAFAGFLTVSFITFNNSSASDVSKNLAVSKAIVQNMGDNQKLRVIKFSGFTKTTDTYMTKAEILELADTEKNQTESEMMS